MPSEPQNPISEENSIPASSQKPMEDAPISTIDSISTDMPPEATEAPTNADIPVSLNNDNSENNPVLTKNPEEAVPAKNAGIGAENQKVEPISESAQTSETPTTQIPVNEPLNPEPEPIKPEPVSIPQPQPEPAPVFVPPQDDKKSLARSLLTKARNAIQFRKRKKLDKILSLFLKQQKITNKEVGEFLHVSDATATRYLDILEKENKIKQTGKTGHAVSYSRI